MTSVTRIDHAHCVRVRAPSALRPAGPRQRRREQVIVGRLQVHHGLHCSTRTVRLFVENVGTQVRKTTSMALVHLYRHNRFPIARTVARRMLH